jgi:16S rRNA (cytosine967-C5)-methyltransferase
MTDLARSQALDALDRVLHGRQPLDAVLGGLHELAGADGATQAFARRLLTTTIRRLGQIDDVIGRALERPLPAKARAARNVLRLGAAQILFMEIPDHAAVDTSVRLFKAAGEGGFAKLVNAVLRRLTREGADWVAAQDAARLNTPDWLWRSWSDAYGETTCRRIAEAHLTPAPLDLSVKSDPDGWAERLGGKVIAGASVRLGDHDAVSSLPGFADGEWWVQDAAARLVTGLIGDVRNKQVIDLCAAPGGKTASLINAGAHVTAVDRSKPRLERLEANMRRLGFEADIVVADAAQWRPDTLADAVLLDAPCSATGTLRRHPDAAWSKTKDDVAKLAATQRRLLGAASEMVKPGGPVLFVTCSLQPEEGPQAAADHLIEGLSLVPSPFQPAELAALPDALTPEGWFRSLPCQLAERGSVDGFFAARFTRT